MEQFRAELKADEEAQKRRDAKALREEDARRAREEAEKEAREQEIEGRCERLKNYVQAREETLKGEDELASGGGVEALGDANCQAPTVKPKPASKSPKPNGTRFTSYRKVCKEAAAIRPNISSPCATSRASRK